MIKKNTDLRKIRSQAFLKEFLRKSFGATTLFAFLLIFFTTGVCPGHAARLQEEKIENPDDVQDKIQDFTKDYLKTIRGQVQDNPYSYEQLPPQNVEETRRLSIELQGKLQESSSILNFLHELMEGRKEEALGLKGEDNRLRGTVSDLKNTRKALKVETQTLKRIGDHIEKAAKTLGVENRSAHCTKTRNCKS